MAQRLSKKVKKTFVISVSQGTGCYRHIRISADKTLNDLSDEILDAFSFDHDHLHSFFMDNRLWSLDQIYSLDPTEPDEPDTWTESA